VGNLSQVCHSNIPQEPRDAKKIYIIDNSHTYWDSRTPIIRQWATEPSKPACA